MRRLLGRTASPTASSPAPDVPGEDPAGLQLAGSARDLAVFAERAARHDPATPVRVQASGLVLAAYVTTPFECLGLRVTRLARDASIDAVVEAVGLAARARGASDGVLALPPRLPDITWMAPLPPRTGWSEVDRRPCRDVRALVAAGTDEFRRRAGQVQAGPGTSAALEAIAEEVWSHALVSDVPARLAHAADYLGFLSDDGEAVVRSLGPWRRLDTPLGVVVARVSDRLGLFVS